MKKAYCSNCGGATEYTLKKPNFCNNCGSSFGVAMAACPAGHKGVRGTHGKQPLSKPVIEEEEEITTIPQIDELDIEISSVGKARGVRLEDLWRSVDTENPNLSQPTSFLTNEGKNPEEQTPEQFMEEFRSEAGTLRNDIPNRGD